LGFSESGFHEHTTELLKGFGVVNHSGGGFYHRGQRMLDIGSPIEAVFEIFVPLAELCSCAERLGLNVAEVEVDSKPFCYIVGLDAPEGGESRHAIVEVRARYHIGTKVRSF
jgi:hypothetical protein